MRAASEALRPRVADIIINSPAVTPGTTDKLNPLTSQIFRTTSSNSNSNGVSLTGVSTSGSSTPFSQRDRTSSSLSSSLSSLRMEDGPQLFNLTVDRIKEDHLVAAREVVKDLEILKELEDDLDYDCERLRSFLLAAQVRFILFVPR